MREPIASTLAPLTEAQVNAYRRLPGSFGEMLQAVYNDGWNGCHAHMKPTIYDLDSQIEGYRAALEQIAGVWESDQDAEAAIGEAMNIAHEALNLNIPAE